jgi:hypothetical protein
MKRLSTIMMCLLAMMAASLSAKAQEVTITLYPGWNWISYPKAEMQDVYTALGDFVPINGDMIQSQFSNSTYVNGYWRGGLTHFMPGWGYKYYSNRTEVVSFVFGTPAPQLIVTTTEPTEITEVSAISGGSLTSSDGSYIVVLEKGICWATHPNPTVMNDFHTENGSGINSFTSEMTDLNFNTIYYVRAYAVTDSGTTYGEEMSFTTEAIPTGAINGKFTINSNGDQVYFSQGNLQYQASTNTWRFAENQWDYVGTQNPNPNIGDPGGTVSGSDNANISENYSGWIDLFGWGTSGYDHGAYCYQPWSTSTSYSDYYAYGNYSYNLYDQTGQADWGYNAISNGGNQANQWRTLTRPEWTYIFNSRTTSSGIRYAKAKVNDVNGVILLPDNWSSDTYSLSNTNTYNASFSSNVIIASQWNTLEQAGAVFLPAAGGRGGTSVIDVGSGGGYWSASYGNSDYARYVFFYDSYLLTDNFSSRVYGFSVRLARVAEN